MLVLVVDRDTKILTTFLNYANTRFRMLSDYPAQIIDERIVIDNHCAKFLITINTLQAAYTDFKAGYLAANV